MLVPDFSCFETDRWQELRAGKKITLTIFFCQTDQVISLPTLNTLGTDCSTEKFIKTRC
jgi:hypothetical protein